MIDLGHPRLDIEYTIVHNHNMLKPNYSVKSRQTLGRSKTSLPSTVRCRAYSLPGVQGNGKQNIFDLNGMDSECCWINWCWFLSWILEYCRLLCICKEYLRSLFVYILCIDMNHFSLFVMFRSRYDFTMLTVEAVFMSWWYRLHDVPCPLFFFWRSQELQDPF